MKHLLLIACASVCLAWASACAALTSNVSILDGGYSPRNDTILIGDVVRWTNTGSQVHTTTGTGLEFWNSGSMGFMGVYSHQFNSTGAFPYRCAYHSTETGTIVVIGATPTVRSSWGTLKRTYRRPTRVPVSTAAKTPKR